MQQDQKGGGVWTATRHDGKRHARWFNTLGAATHSGTFCWRDLYASCDPTGPLGSNGCEILADLGN